jgi:alkylation response protein AidB-like acyl-CoA dehydrogenase
LGIPADAPGRGETAFSFQHTATEPLEEEMTATLTLEPAITEAPAGPAFVELAQEIVPLLRGEAGAIEAARELTPPVLAALAERNLLQVLLAPARGQGSVTVSDAMAVLETLATGDGSTAWDVSASMGAALISGFLPQDTVDRIFVTASNTIATAVGRMGKAIAVDGGYLVEAKWPFLSGSPHAAWIGGLCMVHDGDTARMSPEGEPYIVFPVLRKERVTMLDSWHATGLRGTGSHDAEVSGAFVPTDEVVDFMNGPRPGLPLIYSINENAAAPLAAASVALGIAQQAIESFRTTVGRRAHQSGGTAADAALPQLTLAECEARHAAARAHVFATAAGVDAELAEGRLPGDEWLLKVSLAATGATEAAVEVVSKLYRAAGSSAVFTGSVLDRALRDVFTMGAHRMVQRENYMVYGPKLFS